MPRAKPPEPFWRWFFTGGSGGKNIFWPKKEPKLFESIMGRTKSNIMRIIFKDPFSKEAIEAKTMKEIQQKKLLDAYDEYVKECKEKGEHPLSFAQWMHELKKQQQMQANFI